MLANKNIPNTKNHKMKKTVLIVEDSESVRDFLQFSIEREGYNVLIGINGEDAMKYINDNTIKIDMVLTDLHMPIVDGFGLIKEIRKIERFKRTPILFLTTETSAKQKLRGKESGATGWISKPITSKKIVSIVKKVLR